MEEEEEEYGEMGTPFWVQSTTNLRRVDRFRRGLSSIIFSSGVLLFILLVTALFFMVFVIPTTHMFRIRSNSVMKNWDFVNLVLVLVALFFGFLAKNNTNATSNSEDNQNYYNYQNTATSNVVVDQKNNTDYSDRRDYFSSRDSNYIYPPPGNTRFLRRNSISYPDLHLREQTYDDAQRRFYDDSNLDSYRIVQPYGRRSWEQKNTYVDDEVVSKPDEKLEETESSSDRPPPPPPPPPRRRTTEQKAKRVYPSLPPLVDSEVTHKSLIPPPPPPPPKAKRIYESLPRESLIQHSGRSEYKKRNRGINADNNFLTSYYQKKKEKKRQRQKSVDNLDALFHQSQLPQTHSQPPPPPPPPPQSSSVFHNLFSSRKSKKIRIPSDPHSSSPPPPPPPPPQLKAARVSKTHIQTETTYKTSLPIKIKSFSSLDDNSSSGGSSPLHSIPPPPPPFKMPEWKHVVKGDYVCIQSNLSSRSGSPDTDAENCTPEDDPTPASLFCPSPDVDTKADNFIARFRAGLKLEKIDSFNKKQVSRMSNLGPGSQN